MKKFYHKYKLIIKMALAIVLGIIIGIYMPETIVQFFIAINIIIGKFLAFCVPLIVIGFVIKGISSLGTSSGKMLGITIAISYIFMFCSSLLAYFTTTSIFPYFLTPNSANLGESVVQEQTSIFSHLTKIEINPIMDVVPALIISFIIGIGISIIKSTYIKNICIEFHSIINLLVQNVIIPVLPIYVLGVFVKMSHSGHVFNVIGVFSKVFVVIIFLHFIVLLIQYLIAGVISHKNPLKLLKNILPAYVTALATQSSVAVIPVTIEGSKKNEVSSAIADFVLPLCSTIHLSGSVISITSCSIAVMMLNGWSISFSTMLPFLLILGIMMVAAPGVPCGAILAATGILQSILGFDASMISLMIALHVAQDGFGTACNVSGDGAIAVILDRINKNKFV